MLKTRNKEIEVLHKLIDLGIICLSWLLAYYIRFEAMSGSQEGLLHWYLRSGLLLVFLSYFYFRRAGLYASKRFEPLAREIFTLLKANITAVLVFVLIMYFLSPTKISRVQLLFHTTLSSFMLICMKCFVRKVLHAIRKKGMNIRYVLLFGSSPNIEKFVGNVLKNQGSGIVVKGWIDSNGLAQKYHYPELERVDDDLLNDNKIDLVVLGYKAVESEKLEAILEKLNRHIIEVMYLPDMSYSMAGYSVYDFHGTPIIKLNEPDFRTSSAILKRSLDLVLSSIALILSLPIFFIISFLIKRSSRGPVFYYQERMGLDGHIFRMYKFRSMVSDISNHQGWTVKNDPRVTKIGAFLRKSSLDELPQLWNVLKGDMSLVGQSCFSAGANA